MDQKYRKVIAIDFDGCLCENKYPDIGRPNIGAIKDAIDEQKNGAFITLWTCRDGDKLQEAIDFCKVHGLVFDAINENAPFMMELFGNDTRKIGASEYWDDKAVVRKFTGKFTDDGVTTNADFIRSMSTDNFADLLSSCISYEVEDLFYNQICKSCDRNTQGDCLSECKYEDSVLWWLNQPVSWWLERRYAHVSPACENGEQSEDHK